MHNANWDDLRFVLAVADLGSVSAAARQLGVNHATVLRRVSAFEEANRVSLFERTTQGYRLRPDSLPLIEVARDAAQAMSRVSDILGGGLSGGRDMVRITSVDTLSLTVLAPAIKRLETAAAPQRVAILTSNARLDMGRLQADIALRPAIRLPDDLAGEEACRIGFSVYRAPLGERSWLGLGGALAQSRAAGWMSEHVARDKIMAVGDSFLILREMSAAGRGRSILPCILGDEDPRLVRDDEAGFGHMTVPLWVATHRDLSDAPRLGPAKRALISVVRAEADRISGSGS